MSNEGVVLDLLGGAQTHTHTQLCVCVCVSACACVCILIIRCNSAYMYIRGPRSFLRVYVSVQFVFVNDYTVLSVVVDVVVIVRRWTMNHCCM